MTSQFDFGVGLDEDVHRAAVENQGPAIFVRSMGLDR